MEIIYVSLGPVDHAIASGHITECLPADPGRLHDVTGLQAQPGGTAGTEKAYRIVQVDKYGGAVEFIHIGVIYPRHGKLFEPGNDTGRRYSCRRRHQCYLVPRLRAQQRHEVRAQDDPVFSRLQVVQLPGNHLFRQEGHLRFRLRQDSAGQHTLDLPAEGHHTLGLHVRGDAVYAGMLLCLLRDCLPVPE